MLKILILALAFTSCSAFQEFRANEIRNLAYSDAPVGASVQLQRLDLGPIKGRLYPHTWTAAGALEISHPEHPNYLVQFYAIRYPGLLQLKYGVNGTSWQSAERFFVNGWE